MGKCLTHKIDLITDSGITFCPQCQKVEETLQHGESTCRKLMGSMKVLQSNAKNKADRDRFEVMANLISLTKDLFREDSKLLRFICKIQYSLCRNAKNF